jgi:signal transduction histidine kinase
MPDGGHLVLITEAIQVSGERCVELWVKDTGHGIASEHLDKLFDPFFTTKHRGGGADLGLSICKEIVEAHEGIIWAENLSGEGAAFVARFKLDGP